MKLRQPIRNKFSIVLFLAMCFLTSTMAQAAEFYAIIANLNGASDPHAQIDVALDNRVGSLLIHFNVYRADGTQITEFDVLTNADGFASTSSAAFPNNNLFALSEGLPALVRITTTNVVPGAVVLRQTLDKSNIILGLPSAVTFSTGQWLGVGVYFPLAMGEITHKAFLLIANVSGTDCGVDVFLGTTHGPGSGTYTNSRLANRALWVVEIDPAYADKHMIVHSGGEIVAQLAFDNGKKDGFTEVTVLPAH